MASLLVFVLCYGAGLLLTYFATLELAAGLENQSSLAWYMTTALSFGIFFWTNKKRKKLCSAGFLSYVRSPELDKWIRRTIFTGFSTMQIAVYAGSALFFTNIYWQTAAIIVIVLLLAVEVGFLYTTTFQDDLEE